MTDALSALARNPTVPIAVPAAIGIGYLITKDRKAERAGKPGIFDKLAGAISAAKSNMSAPKTPETPEFQRENPPAPTTQSDSPWTEPRAAESATSDSPSWWDRTRDKADDWTLVGGRVPVPTSGRAAAEIGARIPDFIREGIEGITTGVLGVGFGFGAEMKGGGAADRRKAGAWADRVGEVAGPAAFDAAFPIAPLRRSWPNVTEAARAARDNIFRPAPTRSRSGPSQNVPARQFEKGEAAALARDLADRSGFRDALKTIGITGGPK